MADTKPVIDIDINYIFFHLHEVAKEQAETVSKRIGVENTSVDEKAKTFVSAQSDIRMQLKTESMVDVPAINADQKSVEAFRQECFKMLQKYAEFFFGEQLMQKGKPVATKSAIAIDKLIPIYDKAKVNETVDWRKPLLENLFFEADSSDAPVDPEDEQKEKDAAARRDKARNNDAAAPDADAGGRVVGYKFQYESEINGQKKEDYANNIAKWSKKVGGVLGKIGNAMFGNVINDFKSAKLKTGLGDINVGAMASKLLSGVGATLKYLTKDIFTGIDKDEFALNLQKTFAKDYPWSDITDVRAAPSDSLKLELTRQKKMDAGLQRALDNGDIRWPIVIAVPHGSRDYGRITDKVIAEAISKTFKGDQKVKQKILSITNGIKNIAPKLAEYAKTKAQSAVGKGEETNESFGMDVGETVRLLEDEAPATAEDAADIGSKSDEEAAEELAKDPSRFEKFKAKADQALEALSDKADVIRQSLYFIKDASSPFSHSSIYNKENKAGVDSYTEKLKGIISKSSKKTVSEAEGYGNPVVGSLIATLFEDDDSGPVPDDGPSPDDDEAPDGSPDSPDSPADDADGADGEEKPADLQATVKGIVELLSNKKHTVKAWEDAFDVFEKAEDSDSAFSVSKLKLRVAKTETKAGPDGSDTKEKAVVPIENFAGLKPEVIRCLKSKDPKASLTALFGSAEEPDAKAFAGFYERLKLMVGSMDEAAEQKGSADSDLYVYCNAYLKDKSENGKE